MSSKFDYTRNDILNLTKVNDIVKTALDLYRIGGINDSHYVWERALILAVVELVKLNKHLESALELSARYHQPIEIKFDLADLPEKTRTIVLDSLKDLRVTENG